MQRQRQTSELKSESEEETEGRILRSEVGGQKLEVRGQRSEGRSQKPEAKG